MNYSIMFAEPEANNYFSLIAWVLLNSIVNAVNKESIGHILLQSSTNQIMCISIIR